MKVLITGVAGLLGSRLAEYLLCNKSNVQVIGIDDLSGGHVENIPSEVKFYELDVASDSLASVFKVHKPDIVYHFAAYAAEGLSPFIRMYNYRNNLICTANIINCCINFEVKRLVFTSSIAVYGRGKPPYDEQDIPMPIDPYGVAKTACEQDIQIAGEQHNLDWCILRPHNVYGRNQNIWDKYRNVLGIWMYQYLNNKDLVIFGDGLQKRAFTLIDDCIEPFWNAGNLQRASKQIINIGGLEEVTILDACNKLINIMGGGRIVFLEKRHEVKEAWSTTQKSIDILGYTQGMSFEEGLKDMWLWAKEQPKRIQKKFGDYEISKGIYSYWK